MKIWCNTQAAVVGGRADYPTENTYPVNEFLKIFRNWDDQLEKWFLKFSNTVFHPQIFLKLKRHSGSASISVEWIFDAMELKCTMSKIWLVNIIDLVLDFKFWRIFVHWISFFRFLHWLGRSSSKVIRLSPCKEKLQVYGGKSQGSDIHNVGVHSINAHFLSHVYIKRKLQYHTVLDINSPNSWISNDIMIGILCIIPTCQCTENSEHDLFEICSLYGLPPLSSPLASPSFSQSHKRNLTSLRALFIASPTYELHYQGSDATFNRREPRLTGRLISPNISYTCEQSIDRLIDFPKYIEYFWAISRSIDWLISPNISYRCEQSVDRLIDFPRYIVQVWAIDRSIDWFVRKAPLAPHDFAFHVAIFYL